MSRKLKKLTGTAGAIGSGPRKNYEVGYGRPPKSGQFQPNQSGNPKGRPKGARNFATIVHAVMSSKIPIVGRGQRKCVSADEALLRTFYKLAVNGNVKAGAYLLSLRAQYHPAEVEETPEEGLSGRDQEILQNFIEQFGKPKKVDKS
jgi:hypothetical protein